MRDLPKKHLVPVLVIAAIFLVGLSLYGLGYRLTPALGIARATKIEISHLAPEAKVYVDGVFRGRASENGIYTVRLLPGDYEIIGEKQNHWPWQEAVAVGAADIELGAYMGSVATMGEVIAEDSEAHAVATTALAEAVAPTASSPITADSVSYFVQNGTDIISSATTTPIFTSIAGPIRSLAFFPGRDDLLLVAVEKGIYALEIDAREPRTFQPILLGIEPRFAVKDGAIYGEDAAALFRLDF